MPGASHELTPEALDEALIRSAAMTFLEGYLWGPERPRAAMLRPPKSPMRPDGPSPSLCPKACASPAGARA